MTVQLDSRAYASASHENARWKLQAAKTPPAPPGLGALCSDPVVAEVDVGDRTVGFQSSGECLSGEQRGREQATVSLSP